MIESSLEDLSHTWGWSIEETNDVKNALAHYAQDALMDSDVAAEAESICAEYLMKEEDDA